jgi:hypothetical protein
LSVDKPSAIFKVDLVSPDKIIIQIGLSIEQDQFQTSFPSSSSNPLSPTSNPPSNSLLPFNSKNLSNYSRNNNFVSAIKNCLENFVNFASSFVRKVPSLENPLAYDQMIPCKVVDDWYRNFIKKLESNPNHFF